MKIEVKGNKNYCATIVKVDKVFPIEGADKIQKAIVLNTAVVVSKDVEVGTVGIFFPVETKLSGEYLKYNNLYRDKNLNNNKTKGGFFELNGRIRCVKLKGSASEGLFIPLTSLEYLNIDPFKLNVGDEFDTINNITICEKYIPKVSDNYKDITNKKGKKPKTIKRTSRLVDGIFRLHYDTAQLKKNLHKINRDTLLSISDKWHGTSLVVSKIPVKRKLSWQDKFAKFIGANIKETEYGLVYSSRKVIKNEFEKVNNNVGFYNEDIWGLASQLIYPYLQKGMTAYCEIVGYLQSGKEIQKGYTYCCKHNEFDVRVYRITMTNESGDVIEMPYMQMRKYCLENCMNPVEHIYYGRAENYLNENYNNDDEFREAFLSKLEKEVQNKECKYNKGKPMEGYVIKIDGLNQSEAYKYKNIAFLEYETKMLDKGDENIEDN